MKGEMPLSGQLSYFPDGSFCSVMVDPARVSHLVVLQSMQAKWSLDKKRFIFLFKPHLSANRSTGIHGEAMGKGPV